MKRYTIVIRLTPLMVALLGASFMGVAGTVHGMEHTVAAESGESDFMTRLRKIAEEIETRLLREDPNPVDTNSGGSSGGRSSGSEGESGANGDESEAGDNDDGGAYGYDAETPPPAPQQRTPGDPTKSARTPPDIRPSQDETIIMKNIREAAEKETDSKIREKLWDEYRRYQKEL